MSDTPMTDGIIKRRIGAMLDERGLADYADLANHARLLERRLAATHRDANALRDALQRFVDDGLADCSKPHYERAIAAIANAPPEKEKEKGKDSE